MSALTVMDVVNAVPVGAPVPEGLLVFPIPPLLGWLVLAGLLAAACALLALVTNRAPSRPRPRPAPARRGWPHRRQPQPSS